MNAVNRMTTKFFDVVVAPFELLGQEAALILVSGLFGILSLIVFKHISWQGGIKGTKDKIKGHMIAIRLYQDDLLIVAKSVFKVIWRNFQYLGLNFGPILPLLVPFMLIAAQLVARYGFDPIPVVDPSADRLPGQGTMLVIEMAKGREAAVQDMHVRLPAGLKAVSPLVRNAYDGVAHLEVIAVQPGRGELELVFADGTRAYKKVVTGDEPTRMMQPERVSGFWAAWLWPAEDTFPSDSPLARVSFEYPNRDLYLLPAGPTGIILVFFVSSILFGLLVLKPLRIQI
ncbi:MAG: hypothetical protein O7B99_06415 [Planctomycetota bacterium]|nr:hypothetical protein [Planctomycetota bacterium]